MRQTPLLLAGLAACAGETWTTTEAVVVHLSLPDGPVLDPKLDEDPTLGILLTVDESPEGQTCLATLRAEHSAGQTRTWTPTDSVAAGDSLQMSWDGLDDDGLYFDPGAVQLMATAQCEGGASGTEELSLHVVRLGPVEINLRGGDDGDDIPLAYHMLNLVEAGVTLIDDATPEFYSGGDPERDMGDLDDNDGSPRPAPEAWTNPDVPPFYTGDGFYYDLPTACVAGSVPHLRVTAGATAVSVRDAVPIPATGLGLSAQDLPAIRWAPEGLTPSGDDTWSPGQTVELQGSALPNALGRHELSVTWGWEVSWEDQWIPIPGSWQTRHPLYLLADTPALADGEELGFAPGVAWVGVLDDLADTLQGLDPTTDTILDNIREALNHDPYLAYNPNDSAYTDYQGAYVYWDWIWLDLSGWLARQDGIDLYCHSVSCLLSTLAGMWGVDAPQQVLGVGFTTNQTRAAGSETWQRWSFTSHSVVSPDGGLTIWDASIDLDGDDDPYDQPVEPLCPLGMPVDEYLWRLTYDDIAIVNSGSCYFR